MAKSRSSSPIPGVTPQIIQTSIPNNLRIDTRVFCGFTGGNAGQETSFYTVPQGRILRVISVIKTDDQFVTATDSALKFQTAGGAEILKQRTTGNGPDPNSIIKQEVKLLSGDQIRVLYQTTDVNGRFLWMIQGIEEANLTSYGL